MDRQTIIRQRLMDALAPEVLEIEDQSAHHLGHVGAAGGGHFKILIVSKHFEARSLIERHQQVYKILHDLLQKEIHALSILAFAPGEKGAV